MFRFKILLILLLVSASDNSWDLKKNKDNILVYSRKIETSDFKEIKSTTTVKSSLSSIIKVLTDVDNYTSWVYKCIAAKKVKHISDSEICAYQLFDVPWPCDDRDVVSKLKIVQDKKTKVVTTTSVLADHLVPEKPGIVRVKNFHTRYVLTPKGNGIVEIDYELGTEPGGDVPAWLVNLVAVNAPFNTQQMMNALLQTPSVKSAKFSFIDEP